MAQPNSAAGSPWQFETSSRRDSPAACTNSWRNSRRHDSNGTHYRIWQNGRWPTGAMYIREVSPRSNFASPTVPRGEPRSGYIPFLGTEVAGNSNSELEQSYPFNTRKLTPNDRRDCSAVRFGSLPEDESGPPSKAN